MLSSAAHLPTRLSLLMQMVLTSSACQAMFCRSFSHSSKRRSTSRIFLRAKTQKHTDMNISTILSKIAQADTEDFGRQSQRRDLLRTAVKGAALAAVPLALSALFNKASAQTTQNPIADALNGILLLEYL